MLEASSKHQKHDALPQTSIQSPENQKAAYAQSEHQLSQSQSG
jgi:hypothetical protein